MVWAVRSSHLDTHLCAESAGDVLGSAHQVYYPVGLARRRAARPSKASPSWRVGKWSVRGKTLAIIKALSSAAW